jgi:hypothetical protein
MPKLLNGDSTALAVFPLAAFFHQLFAYGQAFCPAPHRKRFSHPALTSRQTLLFIALQDGGIVAVALSELLMLITQFWPVTLKSLNR